MIEIKKWEHMVVDPEDVDAPSLVSLGDQGWELVSVVYQPGTGNYHEGSPRQNRHIYYFKRPKPAPCASIFHEPKPSA